MHDNDGLSDVVAYFPQGQTSEGVHEVPTSIGASGHLAPAVLPDARAVRLVSTTTNAGLSGVGSYERPDDWQGSADRGPRYPEDRGDAMAFGAPHLGQKNAPTPRHSLVAALGDKALTDNCCQLCAGVVGSICRGRGGAAGTGAFVPAHTPSHEQSARKGGLVLRRERSGDMFRFVG